MPPRVRAEAERKPVAIPKGPLTDAEGRALFLRVRASELRYGRALKSAVKTNDIGRAKK